MSLVHDPDQILLQKGTGSRQIRAGRRRTSAGADGLAKGRQLLLPSYGVLREISVFDLDHVMYNFPQGTIA